jgi:hypothetical protein
MSEKERSAAAQLAQAFELLPENKKEYLLGYAEGVSAMAKRQEEVKNDKPADL